jgi:predicted house-cleaning noncanonical NTP pyrophosphatase (MazG superfamily)
MIHYNKLIRDNVPEIEEKKGKKIVYHAATTDEEYWRALMQKLQEEIDEFGQRPEPDRFTDILDILDAVIEFKKFDEKELQALRENKNSQMGGFSRHWILDQSEEEIGQRQEQGI